MVDTSPRLLWQRNNVLRRLQQSGPDVYRALMQNNNFQAGLDALDPDCPCYVQDKGIAHCIHLGLLSMIDFVNDVKL